MLQKRDLNILLQCAISAAYQAGAIICKHANAEVKSWDKTEELSGEERAKVSVGLASQVVTEVDHLSEATIIKALTPSCEIYNIAMLAEESTDDGGRFKKEYFWCVDPMDGTLPFTQGKPGYCVSIGLANKNGEPVIGVVYNPVEQDLYYAIKGEGAFKNGEKWIVNATGKTLTIITDLSLEHHVDYEEIKNGLREQALALAYQEISIFNGGGSVMNAIWVVEKAPACYFKLPKKQKGGGCSWDYAASTCIVNEMNCVATDINGKAINLNRADTCYMNDCGVLFASDNRIAKLVQTVNQSL